MTAPPGCTSPGSGIMDPPPFPCSLEVWQWGGAFSALQGHRMEGRNKYFSPPYFSSWTTLSLNMTQMHLWFPRLLNELYLKKKSYVCKDWWRKGSEGGLWDKCRGVREVCLSLWNCTYRTHKICSLFITKQKLRILHKNILSVRIGHLN